jgi:prefoldin subunit 5
MNDSPQNLLESRVSTVEKALAGLTEQVTSLSKSVEQIVKANQLDHQETRREIQNLSGLITNSGKTNWNVIFAGLSLVFTLTGGLIWFVLATVKPVADQAYQNEQVIERRIAELPREYYARGQYEADIQTIKEDLEEIRDRIRSKGI